MLKLDAVCDYTIGPDGLIYIPIDNKSDVLIQDIVIGLNHSNGLIYANRGKYKYIGMEAKNKVLILKIEET